MPDLIHDAFSELQDEFYPGSKQRRRESKQDRLLRLAVERQEAKEEAGWDARPIKKTFTLKNGQVYRDVPMFKIGALAMALERRPTTIRSWITKGWIPRARFRTSAVEGSRGDAGRRLWTQSQIATMQRIAQEEGMLGPKPRPITETRFTERVIAEWRRSWI